MVTIKPDGFYHPSTVDEVIELVHKARKERAVLRVKGSGHSVPQAIYPDQFPYRKAEYYAPAEASNRYRLNFQPIEVPDGQIPVLLDKMNKVTFEQRTDDQGQVMHLVHAEAGVHLGKDPYDPTETSTYKNSRFNLMEQQGLAVRDMGGITHQTVGGFLATGSAGGSLQHSLEPNIYAFEFVDGNGEWHYCSREENADLFRAVGVSMGLLGVVTKVIFKANERFDIKGTERIRPISDWAGEIDFFKEGPTGLRAYLEQAEYSRLLWWPQKGVEKMTVWEAHTMQKDEYRAPNSIVINDEKTFVPKPYQEVTWFFGSPLLMENLGDVFYTLVAWLPTWLGKAIKGSWWRMFIQSFVETFWYGKILTKLLDVFVQTDKKIDGEWQPQHFWDTWWRGLPMDNQMDDRLMDVVFTEIWIPLEHTTKVMNTLKDMYEQGGLRATGTFSCELYATKKSEFWMSPAYERDVFRVDLFLSGTDIFSPREYYQQFWDKLQQYDFRTHWGKWVPGAGDDEEGVRYWRDYLHKRFPMWDRFLEVREQLDPDQIFVNDYWRERFNIKPVSDKPLPPPLKWEAPVPPHLVRELETTVTKPNNALLLGAPPLPAAPWYTYLVLLLAGGAIFAGLMWLMVDAIPWYVWNAEWAMVVITAIISVVVGFGSVKLRQWGPIGVFVLTYGTIMFGNLVNALMGDAMWAWKPILGMPLWLSAAVGEVFESAIAATLAWYIGKMLFPKYWPK